MMDGLCSACGAGEGIDRRQFLARTTLLAAAAALAACGVNDVPTAPGSIGATIRVSDYPALANVGGVALVTVNNEDLAVVRTSQTAFVVLSRVCPHQGGIVNQASFGFQCPVHGAQFDQTGNWIGGQRTGDLHAYANSYDASTGTLTIS